MPVQIVNALKKLGYEAEHVQYSMGQGHPFGYQLDKEVDVRENGGRVNTHATTLGSYLERDFDIYHFWNKSLFYRGDYSINTGLDIPLIKARGKKVVYRFSGFDIRTPKKDLVVNKYSPFRYGYQHKFDEDLQQRYFDFLCEYVDQFVVQDPELQQFCPKAKIIPRALDLTEWQYVGVEENNTPLIVHAPSDPKCKGTDFILKALEKLRDKGVNFELKLLNRVSHQEAKYWYKKADIIVDQILIGATGVLTLEGMALGKPVVVYLREDLFDSFYNGQLPVANANPDTIEPVLKELIEDYEYRKELSINGRKLVEKYHDINHVIKDYVQMYDKVFGSSLVLPSGIADVEYFKSQSNRFQWLDGFHNRTIRNNSDADYLIKIISRLTDEQKNYVLNGLSQSNRPQKSFFEKLKYFL